MIIVTRVGRIRILSSVLAALLLVTLPVSAAAYVLMGEHVLDLMVKALGQADTLEVSQTVTVSAAATATPLPSSALQETVRIRFPYDFRADASSDGYQRQIVISGGTALMAVNGVLQGGALPRYLRYNEILMVKPRQALADHLRMLGVDVTISSLGRLEDHYCYVVGARFPDETVAQLWVAKDTFYPLRLILPPTAMSSGEGPVEIRYRNWTFTEGVAYPMHVIMRQNHQIMQEIRVDRLQINPVFTSDLFDITTLRREWSRPAATDAKGERTAPEAAVPPSIE
jgi:hypothetical protein